MQCKSNRPRRSQAADTAVVVTAIAPRFGVKTTSWWLIQPLQWFGPECRVDSAPPGCNVCRWTSASQTECLRPSASPDTLQGTPYTNCLRPAADKPGPGIKVREAVSARQSAGATSKCNRLQILSVDRLTGQGIYLCMSNWRNCRRRPANGTRTCNRLPNPAIHFPTPHRHPAPVRFGHPGRLVILQRLWHALSQ